MNFALNRLEFYTRLNDLYFHFLSPQFHGAVRVDAECAECVCYRIKLDVTLHRFLERQIVVRARRSREFTRLLSVFF